MSILLTDELRQAIQQHPEHPLELEDAQTRTSYLLMTQEQFRRLVYDDSDLTNDEMVAAALVTADLDDAIPGTDDSSPSDAIA